VDVLDGKTVVWEGGVVAEVRIEIDIGKGAGGVDVVEEEKVFLREVLIQPGAVCGPTTCVMYKFPSLPCTSEFARLPWGYKPVIWLMAYS